MICLMAISKAGAQNVDLQAVSIDPSPGSLVVGATGQILVTMKNNGPAAIPMGDATAQITLSSVYLDLGVPFNFVGCGQWTYLGNIPGAGTYNLFFQNNGGAIPAFPNPGNTCTFQFDVKGKAGTPAPSGITLASSLSATATSNDVDGSNQAATTEITVTGTPDLTNSQFFSSLQITAGGTIDEVVSIRNVGASPTTAPIVFTVTSYAPITGLSLAGIATPTVTIGFTTYTLDNANWSFNPATGVFTSNAGVFILAGATKFLGVRVSRLAGANGSVTHSSTITAGTGGGETPTNNNSISNTLLKN